MTSGQLGRWLIVFAFGIWGVTVSTAESVTLSQGEIQQLVYEAHLMTLLDERPELEAGLLLLLELDRRNPEQSARVLTVLHEALVGYRNNVLSFYNYPLSRDMYLVTFTEYLVTHVNVDGLRPASLTLVNDLILESYSATMNTTVRSHAGNYAVLGGEHAIDKRQALVEELMDRAHLVYAFGNLVNRFLGNETNVRMSDSPARILQLNEVLTSSPTMLWLVDLYDSAESAPVEVSIAEFEAKFEAEMALIRGTISVNQDLHKSLESAQGELSIYLMDSAKVLEQQSYQQQVREGQAECISASSAAAHAISFSIRSAKPDTAKHMETVATSMKTFARGLELLDSASKFGKLAACTNFVSAGLSLVSIFFDTGPSADEMILEEINFLKQMIQDLATHMDYRFDRVDKTLNLVLEQLDYSIHLIGEVGHDVDQLRLDLLDVQAGLCRLEREIYGYLTALERRDFIERRNADLRYEFLNQEQMTWERYTDLAENTFYTWAVDFSPDLFSSPVPSLDEILPSELKDQLSMRPLESNLNYINQFLYLTLGVPQLSYQSVPNPRDWFAGADTYIKLAVENPLHFRRKHWSRIEDVISTGRQVETFLGKLSLLPNGEVNYPLYEAIFDYYASRLDNFIFAFESAKEKYAGPDMDGFAYAMWEDWERACEEQLVQEAAVTGSVKSVRLPTDIIQVAVGDSHTLALRSNGSVIGWGYNVGGACDVPVEATGIVQIEAGYAHSLALKNDGTVIAWGSNSYGQCDVPNDLSDVVSIALGPFQSMALKSDGTVVVWGYHSNDVLAVPEGLSNVVAIAAGGDSNRDTGAFCLALTEDRKVVAWGHNWYGECNVPAALANGELDVVQIAGKMIQAAAVLADGSVIAWPDPISFSKPVSEIAMFNWGYVVGLCKDGTVEVAHGDPAGKPEGNDIIQVSAGSEHAVALHQDGRITAWGTNRYGRHGLGAEHSIIDMVGGESMVLLILDDGSVEAIQVSWGDVPQVPDDLPPLSSAAIGQCYQEEWCLGLTVDGNVVAWGDNAKGQCNVPDGLTDVVEVSAGICSDGGHSLALRKDGTVVGWGDNSFGQRNPPAGLDNAVAIAAGWRHSAALKSNGKVVTWGNNWYGQQNIPQGLDNVVAISSRRSHILALKADGTVVAWGENNLGQCNVPQGLADVIAIEAGEGHSLALKSDGSVVAWGSNQYGILDYANSMTGVLKISSGISWRDHFLVENSFPSDNLSGPYSFFPRHRPSVAVSEEFARLYEYVLPEFGADLSHIGSELTGAKKLIEAVISLALPQSLEQDDALRGFLLGSETIPDHDLVKMMVEEEIAALRATLSARPIDLNAALQFRYPVFQSRLYECLNAVEARGKPEIPRMVSYTLSLLEILRHTHLDGLTPAPILCLQEATTNTSSFNMPVYGEPYINYKLEQSTNPSIWVVTTESLRSEDSLSIDPDIFGGSILLRALAP